MRIDGNKPQTSSAISERLVKNQIILNDELIEIIFGHIRNEYKLAIHSAPWINEKLSNFIIDKVNKLIILYLHSSYFNAYLFKFSCS